MGNKQIRALIDTGSAVTLCSSSLLSGLRESTTRLHKKPMDLRAANGLPLHISDYRTAKVVLNSRSTLTDVFFVDDLQVPCILGMDFLHKAGILIDAGKQRLLFRPRHPPTSSSNRPRTSKTTFLVDTDQDITIKPLEETKVIFDTPSGFIGKGIISSHPQLNEHLTVMDGLVDSNNLSKCAAIVLNTAPFPVLLSKKSPLASIERVRNQACKKISEVYQISHGKTQLTDISHLSKIDLSHIPTQYLAKYKSLLCEFASIFSKHDLDVGHCKTLPHQVRLTDPNKIVSINQYRLPYHLKEVAIDYVDRLLKSGVIRPSTSVFNSPLMLVKKPNADPTKPLAEQYRLVHNYVELNKSISPCSYPLRHLYELLDEVASGKIFSVLDLSQGFFQQSLIDPHESTSFSIPGYGQFTYNRSPQGLNSSPAYFQRLLDYVLKGIARCYVYIDDVVVSVTTHEENLQTLRHVFTRFQQHNLKIKPSKCHIGTGQISYLGYEISADKGVKPGLAKTLVIKEFPEPRSVKEIRAFIGLTSFFRRAIPNFSSISAALNKLVRKDSGFKAGSLPPDARKSFIALKNALISRPCLAPVNFNRRFIVTTDASETHYGSCLSQVGSDGLERPCGFSSKLLSDKESKQQPGMRERAALLHALRHWQPYFCLLYTSPSPRDKRQSRMPSSA